MGRRTPASTWILAALLAGNAWAAEQVLSGEDLARAFQSPPRESYAWCYWWWLNGAASKEGITRDFEEMKKQGIAGALLFDAGEAGPEEGIKHYSGTATYQKTFLPPPSAIQNPESAVYLDLVTVKNVARVKLNGRDLGVVWTAPWQVEVTGAIRPGTNDLEIEVANRHSIYTCEAATTRSWTPTLPTQRLKPTDCRCIPARLRFWVDILKNRPPMPSSSLRWSRGA